MVQSLLYDVPDRSPSPEFPLIQGAVKEMIFEMEILGMNWGEINEQEFQRMESLLTVDQKEKKEQEYKAQQEDLTLTAEAARMADYAKTQKIVNTVGKGHNAHIHKTTGPCKWLYCDEKAPKSQWRKNEQGEWCAPVMRAITGAQCWAWEYMDPKSKQFKKPHTCKYLHPGEPGWLPEWNKDRCFKPVAPVSATEQRFVSLKPVAPAVKRAQMDSAW